MFEVQRVWDWLSVEPRFRRGTRVLQIAIGLMWLFRLSSEGPYFEFLWGPRGIGQGTIPSAFGPVAGGLDLVFRTGASSLGLLLVMAVAAYGLLAGRHTRVASAVLLAGQVMLEHRLTQLSDGGDNVCRLVLGYMIFVLPPRARAHSNSLTVWISNLAVLAIATQLCVLYFTSGIMKAYGEKWHNGTAMYYISQVEWFSEPWIRSIFKAPLIVTLATVVPMVYQLLFPTAVLSPLKLPWLAVGVAFHLGIAVMMGLVTFSTIMIGLELFLITDNEYSLIGAQARNGWRSLMRRRPAGEKAAPRYAVFFDGGCPHCRRTAAWLQRLDLGRSLSLRSFRSDMTYRSFGISPVELEQRLHLVDLEGGGFWSGFDAFAKLTKVLPLLRALSPVAWMARRGGVGPRLYEWIAAHRRIDAHGCAGRELCESRSSDARSSA